MNSKFKTIPVKHISRICLLVGAAFMLSACQLVSMAGYQWHNAGQDVAFAPGKESTSVPFSLVNQHILVEVNVNQQGPFRFVLDSGAAASVITQTKATDLLNLPRDNPLNISGTGDGNDPVAYVVHGVDIAVGSLSISQMSAIFAPTDAMPFDTEDETYFDGVLGADFFNCCLVEIDYQSMMLSFYPSQSEEVKRFSTDEWQKLDMQVQSNTPFLITDVDDGKQRKSAKVLLDTGSTGTLSLFTGNGDFSVPGETYQARSTGISGDSINHVGYLKHLSMGQYALEKLPVYFRTHGENPQQGSHGILGNRVMKRFNQVFDFQGERYWIKPNALWEEPVAADRSGLRLLPHANGAVVKDIASGSTAEMLHIALNTVVTHIDQEPVDATSYDTLVARLRAPQRESVSLCWQEDARSICKALTLQDRLN